MLDESFEKSHILIAQFDQDGRYSATNKIYSRWMGLAPDVVGKSVQDVLGERVWDKIKPYMEIALSGEEVRFELKVPDFSAQQKWLDVTHVPIRRVGEVVGFYSFALDIDARKNAEFDRLTLMNAIENGIEGFSVHDKNGLFTYVNPAEAQMYGYSTFEVLGNSWEMFYDDDEIDRIKKVSFPCLIEEGHWRGELKGKKKNGDHFDVEVSLNMIRDEDDNNTGLFCACRDISERKQSQALADFLAYHDSLTGLPNRLLFRERLDHAIVDAGRRNSMLAILFIDLDYFKQINDTLGHTTGDKLLKQVALRLREVFRSEDTIARLSGDEFTVLLCDILSQRAIETVVDKLLKSFRDPLHIDDRVIHQSVSVGISVFPRDGDDVETLMKNADAAMYHVKEEGRQGFHYYNTKLTDCAQESMLYRSQLRSALARHEFVLHYQPLVSLIENRVIGYEALIRWQHPEQGLIYPDKFIRHAEESNLIAPMGYWVLEQVCRDLKEWRKQGVVVDFVSVNVSGLQLQGDFVKDVTGILRAQATSPSQIDLEITETFLMRGLKEPVRQLKALRALGISLSIDDFGVGYSSLSRIKQLPVQCLKIDRSFVGDIVDDPDDRAIVEAIIAMGTTLKLGITAEGVETKNQHLLLQRLGCDRAQGYHYHRPAPSERIATVHAQVSRMLAPPDEPV